MRLSADKKQKPNFLCAAFIHNLRTMTPGFLIALLILAGLFWIESYWPWSVSQDLVGTERRWDIDHYRHHGDNSSNRVSERK